MMKKIPFLLAMLCASLSPLAAEGDEPVPSDQGYAVASHVDWARAAVSLEITAALDPSTASLMRAKGDAETSIQTLLPELLTAAIAGVTVDSSHTLGQVMARDAGTYAAVNGLARAARRTELFLSLDQTHLVARYVVPFFGGQGIALPLLPGRATPIPRRLGEVATRPYTGLLIYAMNPLPAAGTAKLITARPALFPRIWDEEMNLVLDMGMCSPEALARGGMAVCARDADDPAVFTRVGALPLRCAARGVFGETPTDIVLSVDAARQLLTLPENIAFLREGRIAIIYGGVE